MIKLVHFDELNETFSVIFKQCEFALITFLIAESHWDGVDDKYEKSDLVLILQ